MARKKGPKPPVNRIKAHAGRGFKCADFRELLKDTPIPDREIAEAAGVSQTTVYRWRTEKANPSLHDIVMVTQFIENRAASQVERARHARRKVRGAEVALRRMERTSELSNGDLT